VKATDLVKIGESIRYYRKFRKLTQKELAEDICTQAQISKMEKGEVLPLSSTLFLISIKLGIKVNDLFYESAYTRYDYMKTLTRVVRTKITNHEYADVLQIIDLEKDNYFNSTEMTQFILWHKGICIAHVHKDYQHSIDLLKESLSMTNKKNGFCSERELEIINSLAIVYDLSGNSKEAHKYYKRALKDSTILPSLDPNIKARMLYGLAKIEKSLGNLEKSIEVSEEGRLFCINNGLLYLLGEFLYQKGYCMILLEEKTGDEYVNLAIMIFKLQGNYHLAELAERNLNEALQKVEHKKEKGLNKRLS
jgi:transcriptional regulator with XRE-family HTH domain